MNDGPKIAQYVKPCPENGTSHDCSYDYYMWMPTNVFDNWLVEHDRAVAEKALSEHDADMGRWRWPERRWYVVYPSRARDDTVSVLNELNGDNMVITKGSPIMQALGDSQPSVVDRTVFAAAARAYWAEPLSVSTPKDADA